MAIAMRPHACDANWIGYRDQVRERDPSRNSNVEKARCRSDCIPTPVAARWAGSVGDLLVLQHSG
eukprot:6254164-Prymnesium_polylepis.1